MALSPSLSETRLVWVLSCIVVFPVLVGLTDPIAVGAQGLTQDTVVGNGDRLDRPVRIYLDCQRCDRSFIRRNLTFVDYVRDRKQADVHLLGTTQGTGGGGLRYRLEFIGQGPFEGLHYTLTYDAASTLTRDQRRRGLADRIRLGLVPFASQTPVRDQLSVNHEPSDGSAGQRTPEDDPWNQWVFEVSASGRLDVEQKEQGYDLRGELEAERITEAWKIELEVDSDYELDLFEIEGETVESESQDYDFDAGVVKSLGPHWGAGLSGTVFSRTFTNTHLATRASPAIEYNVFPYEISDQKELTVTYRVGPEYRNYREVTIFNQREEFLVQQSLRVALDLDQPWGSVSSSLRGSHYFHDLSKNRVQFNNWLRLQLIEGLSLRLSLHAELIQDQLHLAAEDPDDEDVLLRRRERATSYQFRSSVGLSYTFGSIYNNVVNTRL